MMKKLNPLFIFLLMIISVSCLYSYNTKEFAHFNQTGSCKNCDLSGAIISVKYNIYPPYNLKGSNMSNAAFSIGNASGSDFSDIKAIRSKFAYNSTLSKSNFTNAILIDSEFIGVNLMYANFKNANLQGVNFMGSNLYGAKNINFSDVKNICNAIMPNGKKAPKC
jgi:uncharacterized protein YjbI with pentapeptide repeats